MSALAFRPLGRIQTASQSKQADPLIPAFWETVAAGALLLFYLVSDALFGPESYGILNFFGPLWLALMLFGGAWRMTLIDPVVLWLSFFWFRIATAIYFGLGAVAEKLFNTTTLIAYRRFFSGNAEQLFTVNVILAFSILTIFLSATIIGIFWKQKSIDSPKTAKDRLLFICAMTFILIGYSDKYFIEIPYWAGYFGNIQLPGMVIQVAHLAVAGLFLLTLWCLRFAPKLLFIPYILLFTDMTAGILLFNKTEVLKPLAVFIFALLQKKITPIRLLAAAAVVLFVFKSIVPMVEYGRDELYSRYGNIAEGSLTERFDIMSLYARNSARNENGEEFQSGLARIAYANVEAATVYFREIGIQGDSLNDAFTMLIPRAIWPNKPIYDGGSRFNQMVTGNYDSSSWMGIYAEAYWNHGWLGILIVMPLVTLCYFLVGRMTISIVKNSMWIHFPIVFFGMYMGMRVDGAFALDILSLTTVCLLIYVIAGISESLVRPYLGEVRSNSRLGRR